MYLILYEQKGVIRIDWKTEAERLILQEGVSIRGTASKLNYLFPDKTHTQMRDMVRGYIRNKPEYKALKNEDKPAVNMSGSADGSKTFDGLVMLHEGELITPEIIMKAFNIDSSAWEVLSWKANFWQAQRKGGSKMLLYQSKITVKPKDSPAIDLSVLDKHFAELDRKHFIPPAIIVPRDAHYMAEINIADLHLGKLCWHGSTGENYDYKIAREMFYSILSETIAEIKHHPTEYATFVWTNDYFNADTIDNTTTGLTPQECDVRWQKMFNVGVEMLVRGTELIQSELKTPIHMFYTPSNHDEVNGYHAIKYLEAWFRNDKTVHIDISAYPRKYQLYGNTLLGYCHGSKENSKGNKEKASRLASLMPIEARDMWSQSKYREFHTAHLHSEHMIEEMNGVIVRRISSPTAADTWHVENGYVGSVRKAQTFIYEKQRGLIYTINTPVEVAG